MRLPISSVQFSSIQWLSRVRLFGTPWTAACQASLSITNSQSPLKPMFIESVMPSNHLILCRPLLLPSIFPSITVFSNESALCIRWPKYWSFSFSISASNEYSGLISFRIDWLDLLAVQGTLKSLFQHHSSLLVCCYLLLWLKRLKKIHPHCYAVWKGNDILFLDDFYIIVAVVSYYPNTTQVVVSQIVMCNPKLYQWTFHILLH